MLEPIACPLCRHEFDFVEVFDDTADQRALNDFVHATCPIPDRVMRYIALFAPLKQRLTIRKQLRLMRDLTPDLARQAITFNGRDWPAPHAAWATVIDDMLARRALGTLELPMRNHNYLRKVLASMANKAEAAAEAQREADRRQYPQRDTVTVRGQSMSIGEGLQTVYGGKDPALAKLDDDNRKAAPMPPLVAELRERINRGEA